MSSVSVRSRSLGFVGACLLSLILSASRSSASLRVAADGRTRRPLASRLSATHGVTVSPLPDFGHRAASSCGLPRSCGPARCGFQGGLDKVPTMRWSRAMRNGLHPPGQASPACIFFRKPHRPSGLRCRTMCGQRGLWFRGAGERYDVYHVLRGGDVAGNEADTRFTRGRNNGLLESFLNVFSSSDEANGIDVFLAPDTIRLWVPQVCGKNVRFVERQFPLSPANMIPVSHVDQTNRVVAFAWPPKGMPRGHGRVTVRGR